MPTLVGAGSQRLPGLSGFARPSITITTMMSSVERIPNSDVYDKTDRGRTIVGIKLWGTCQRAPVL